MRVTRLAAMALAVGLIVFTVVVAVTFEPTGAPNSSASAPGTPAAESQPPPRLRLAIDTVGSGPHFEPGSDEPTADVAQSKLWFHDGAWWGVLVAEGTDEFRIHRFDWEGQRWIDTGARVGPRTSVQPDALSRDATVWVATGGWSTSSRAASLTRFTYDPANARYAPDPDFPVRIADERARGLTLARDVAGRLWAAWIGEDGLMIRRTDGNDLAWGDPHLPALTGASADIDAAAIVSHGDSVALLWTTTGSDAVSIGIPTVDGAERWDRIDLDVAGLAPGDDQVQLVGLDEPDGPRLFALMRTSLAANADSNPGDPGLILVVVGPDGGVRQHLVSHLSDRLTRAALVLDADGRRLYVIAAQASSGTIRYKVSDLDAIGFEPGEGTVLIESDEVAAITAATSTKDAVGSGSGLLVLASDATVGSYAWAAARLGEGDPVPVSSAGADPVPVVDPMAHDTFDPLEPGSAVGGSWEMTGGLGFVVTDLEGGHRAAVAAGGGDSGARMCRDLSPIGTGAPTVEVEFMISQAPASDVTVTSVRHTGAQSAVVRLDDGGTFSYFDGTSHIRSEVRYAVGVWYTSVVELDVAGGTYDWQVTRSADGATAFSIDGAAWRATTTDPVTGICLEAGTGDATFAVDQVRVDR